MRVTIFCTGGNSALFRFLHGYTLLLQSLFLCALGDTQWGGVNHLDLLTTKCLHGTGLQLQAWNMTKDPLNPFYTARTDWLPCMSGYAHMWSNFVNFSTKICPQKQLRVTSDTSDGQSDEWYFRWTVFNVLEGQTEPFFCKCRSVFEK